MTYIHVCLILVILTKLICLSALENSVCLRMPKKSYKTNVVCTPTRSMTISWSSLPFSCMTSAMQNTPFPVIYLLHRPDSAIGSAMRKFCAWCDRWQALRPGYHNHGPWYDPSTRLWAREVPRLCVSGASDIECRFLFFGNERPTKSARYYSKAPRARRCSGMVICLLWANVGAIVWFIQDADRLDSIRAAGIGRTFTYSGAYGMAIQTSRELFDSKLFSLEKIMKTEPGRIMAEERNKRLRNFAAYWDEEISVILTHEFLILFWSEFSLHGLDLLAALPSLNSHCECFAILIWGIIGCIFRCVWYSWLWDISEAVIHGSY